MTDNNLKMNAVITYFPNGFTFGDSFKTTEHYGTSWNDWNWCWPNYHYHTIVVNEQPNKFELAFKIVSKLMETKVIDRLTVKQFIATVNDIAKLI